ncbi:MAG: prenyltransferase/squalene oxidase repeat-containing protein [Chloroflexota bacterium]|nr:prenyltransferase/squalene oxidase repeat-containing protein [Chloroflexota bacterium]
MDIQRSIHHLLKEEIGPSLITRSAYDTAWVARLSESGEPIGEQALEWLREHQLADGSWGASELEYYHDRLICTLAAVTALARRHETQDHARLQRAQPAIEKAIKGLKAAPADETVGFEMIVPTLLAEAKALGIIQPSSNGILDRLVRQRAAKIATLSGRKINRFVTVAFSAEMVGPDGLHLLDVDNLQEANGSVSYSPAATAFFAQHVHCLDSAALGYLNHVAINGAVPYVAPIEIFERAWPLWNLALIDPLDNETLALCQPHLNFLETEWKPGEGIAACAGLTLLDGDDTSLTFDVLARFGRPVDLEGLLHYEKNDHFRCYTLETNPSISTNIHALGALRQAGLGARHPSVQKILRFLQHTRTPEQFWFGKWHASPYYPTSHAVIACAGYNIGMVDNAIRWILETQNTDGSWGYYTPTAEETAYCLQALVVWRRHGGQVPGAVLKRGAVWLADHTEPPYPPLWIGKCLYCPILAVRSAVLSAMMLVAQE